MTSISKGEVNKKLILEVAFLYGFMARCIFLLSAKMMNTCMHLQLLLIHIRLCTHNCIKA